MCMHNLRLQYVFTVCVIQLFMFNSIFRGSFIYLGGNDELVEWYWRFSDGGVLYYFNWGRGN